MMTLRDFKIGWRLLVAQPMYSIVVILGLSVGFASCFLMLSYVRYSDSYDKSVPDAARIHFLMTKANFETTPNWSESAPFPLFDVARHDDSVELVTPVLRRIYSYRVAAQVVRLDTLVTQPSIGSMFGIQTLQGDLHAALTTPDRIALTISSAKKMFGTVDIIGKTVQVNENSYTVGALIADPPSNSTVYYEALAGFDSPIWSSIRDFVIKGWSFSATKIFVKLRPGFDDGTLTRNLQRAVNHSPLRSSLDPAASATVGKQNVLDIRLGALTDAYFENTTEMRQSKSPRGDRKIVHEFEAMALIILLLAVTNYVNLATVRTLHRQREVSIRKMLGASTRRVAIQFMTESVIVALVATGIGLTLTWLLLPVFSEYVDRQLEHEFTLWSALAAIWLGSIVGLLAAAYPAWMAIKFRVLQTLGGRGSNETGSGLWLRRVLTILQFAAAMALSGVTLAMYWQTQFAMRANPGFDTRALLVLELPKDMTSPASQSLRDALKQIPGVNGVIASADPLGTGVVGGDATLIKADGARAAVQFRPVSANFFETLGVKPIAGRLFDSKIDRDDLNITSPNVIVINRSAALALGYADPQHAVGQVAVTNTWTADNPRMETLRIVGVAPDLRLTSLHELAVPQLAYMPFSMTPVLTLKVSGNLDVIEAVCAKLALRYFPNDVIDIRREQNIIEQNYLDDLRMTKLLGAASLIAVLIAAFGIYVLSSYNLQRLSKQIVLRKLLGAMRRHVAALIGREFIVLIAIGALIGLPIAGIAIANYLATFMEHAPIGGWTLLFALILALAVTLLSTLRHTLIAMRLAPIQILRD